MRFLSLLLAPIILGAQLIPPGQPIPGGPNPPVVFLNGYQISCGGTSFEGAFGNAATVLQASQRVSVFFNNCNVNGSLISKPSIEKVAAAFGDFLGALKYSDGTAVTVVDVVAHSMGGLVLRTYLSGKAETSGTFVPPSSVVVRKVVFLASPHFGTPIAKVLPDTQTLEMLPGSQFLFDLNTWNQGTDDLRGVDAIAVAANSGTGTTTPVKGFDDGVVALTSASLGFIGSGRTRVVAACHAGDALLSLFNLCSGPSIANVADSSSAVGQIIVSFLGGTNNWQSLGQPIEASPTAGNAAGLLIGGQDKDGTKLTLSTATTLTNNPTVNLAITDGNASSDIVDPKTDLQKQLQLSGGTAVLPTARLTAAGYTALVAKPGPQIARALPAPAGLISPLSVAPGEYVALYGANLATATKIATQPYPQQIDDVQVLVNGVAANLVFVSAGQINFIYPDSSKPGITKLTIKNSAGQHTVNVMVAAAVPSIFSLDGTGSGAAAAIDALTGIVPAPSAPFSAGQFVALFLTGLGANPQADVTVGAVKMNVLYAGRSPGFQGLDQINFQLPAGLSGSQLPVVVSAGGRTSNTVTIPVQ
jgi:uncharacterized protein (TIGR03437 family)